MNDDEEKQIRSLSQVAYAAHKLNDANVIQGGVDTSFDIMNTVSPKAGSYKYRRPDTNEIIVVAPGETMYSVASMFAFEQFDGENWVNLETGEKL